MDLPLTEKSKFLIKTFAGANSIIKVKKLENNNKYLKLQKIIFENLQSIYDKINLEYLNDFSKLRTQIDNNYEIIEIVNKHLQPSQYLNHEIANYISKNVKTQNNYLFIKYTIPFNSTQIVLNFISFRSFSQKLLKQLDKIVKIMFASLLLINNLTQSTSIFNKPTLNVYFFLTPFMKHFDINDKHLGAKNCNTGFTYPNLDEGLIVIYRLEEFFKVLIHESIHNAGVDSQLFNLKRQNYGNDNKTQLYNKFLENFNLQKVEDLGFNEAITEFWANYVFFSVYAFDKQTQSFNDYQKKFERIFLIQQIFTMFQISKILHCNGIKYRELLTKFSKNDKYNESTHVISYYLFKFFLIVDYKTFIERYFENRDITKDNINIKFGLEMYNFKMIFNYINIMSLNKKIDDYFMKSREIFDLIYNNCDNNFDFLKYNLYMCVVELNLFDYK
tara:strand:+ start:330 stop:1664 length:1335 start_codon:yes stop_codon:yes gene_type:complete